MDGHSVKVLRITKPFHEGEVRNAASRKNNNSTWPICSAIDHSAIQRIVHSTLFAL